MIGRKITRRSNCIVGAHKDRLPTILIRFNVVFYIENNNAVYRSRNVARNVLNIIICTCCFVKCEVALTCRPRKGLLPSGNDVVPDVIHLGGDNKKIPNTHPFIHGDDTLTTSTQLPHNSHSHVSRSCVKVEWGCKTSISLLYIHLSHMEMEGVRKGCVLSFFLSFSNLFSCVITLFVHVILITFIIK
jgi:hypothetical protein